jgi:hypothetical protein
MIIAGKKMTIFLWEKGVSMWKDSSESSLGKDSIQSLPSNPIRKIISGGE